MLLITWAVMVVLSYVYYEYIDQQQTATRRDLLAAQNSVDQLSKQVQAGNPAVATEISEVKEQLLGLSQQIETYKRALGDYEDKASLRDSERAVSRVRAASLATQFTAIRQQLAALKAMDAQWQVQLASLMSGEPGRKVVGSPAQLELLLGVLDQAILKETAAATPAEATLEAVVAERDSAAALKAAIEFTEEQSRQISTERAKTAQALLDARLAHERTLREIELTTLAANTEVEAQKIKDAIAQVQREEQQRQSELKARVEREVAEAKFQQALPEIRTYLIPFISDGTTQPGKRHRQYESAAHLGPVSFSALQRFGVLDETPKGLFALHALGGDTSSAARKLPALFRR